MQEKPKFFSEFSKNNFPEERDELAKKIREIRREVSEEKTLHNQASEAYKNISEEAASKIAELDETKETLEKLSGSLPKKIYNYFKLKSLRSKLIDEKKDYGEMIDKQAGIGYDLHSAEQKIESSNGDIHRALNTFYEMQKDKWQKAGYDKGLVEKYFTEEHLSSLTIKDLALLMSRFPSDMVTHVTRQGIRDHVGMFEHQTGKNELNKGFEGLLQDGRLRSSLGLALAEGIKKETVSRVLQLDRFATKEEAEAYLRSFDNDRETPTTPDYADRIAIHVAVETVADALYGAEKGNEIFITYPSLHVASQYFFRGTLNDEVGSGNYNDQWIWANEERGMSIDAGVIFIPKNAKVSRLNGSRYQIDSDSKPIVNKPLIQTIENIKTDSRFRSLAAEYSLISQVKIGEVQNKKVEIKNYLRSTYENLDEDLLGKLCAEDIIYEINSEFVDAEKILRQLGRYFIEASDTIRSQEYWENYFASGKANKPSKIVYYEGEDPTLALKKWKTENGLNKSAPTGDMGFEEHKISSHSEESRRGLDRFRSIAQEIINEHYASIKNP